MPFTAGDLKIPTNPLADLVWNLDCNWFDHEREVCVCVFLSNFPSFSSLSCSYSTCAYQYDASTAETCLFLPANPQCVVLYIKVLGLKEEDLRAVKQELSPMQGRLLHVTDMKK